MKAVILAGGLGTRISEESHLRPKPMIEIGGKPILWHIMKLLGAQGINDFIICCGYKGYVVKEYFANYFLHMSDVTFHLADNRMELHQGKAEPWRVTLVDTGETTMTGGRLRRVANYIDDTFCLTYGDGVADVDLAALIAQHRTAGLEATVTAIQPPGRYGALDITENRVNRFLEKPVGDGQWINGGFFICEPSVLSRVTDDITPWESTPLENLAKDGQLGVYKHRGFWAAMDTLRDKQMLEELWLRDKAPWKIWH
jgi:glucose-1-phosphate cytidylyltransferase